MLLVPLSNAQAALNQSTKPLKISIYLEENLPFSGFNDQDIAEGLLVDYWVSWSNATDINVEFKVYDKEKLPHLLNSDKPALYSGFNIHPADKPQLVSTSLMGISSQFYFLSHNENLLKSALIDNSVPMVVGGLLPQAKQLPLIKNNKSIIYKEYPGFIEMLGALYLEKIDSFILFKAQGESESFIDTALPYLLSHTGFNAISNELYAYAPIKEKELLEWVRWGSDSDYVEARAPAILTAATIPMWNVSGDIAQYLLIILSILLLFILSKTSRSKKDQQFKDILDASPYPVLIASLNGKSILYINDEAKFLFASKKAKKNVKLEDERNQKTLVEFFKKLSHQSKIENSIVSLRVGKGVMDIEISAKRIHHLKESVWLCYFKDVTELLKTQRSLYEERERFSSVLNRLPEQIYFKSLDGKLVGGNSAWAKSNNASIDELIGLKEFELQDKLSSQRTYNQESPVWAGEVFNNQEWIEQKGNGSRLMNITKIPLYDRNKKIFSLASISLDITETHRLTETLNIQRVDLEKTKKTLETQSVLLKSLFDSTTYPMGIVSEDGIVLIANKYFSHFMGTDIEDITGASKRDLLPYERADWSDRQNKEVLESMKSITFEEFVFFQGKEIWYEVNKSPFFDTTSNLKGIIITAKDITERKNNESGSRQSK